MKSFSPRATWSQLSLLSFIAVAALGATGCPDQHIGRKCDLGRDVDGGAKTAFSNTGALECPSRICILPDQDRTVMGTGPLCTAECSSDDDCADGELRANKTDNTDSRCRDGFACRRLFSGLSTNELACKRLCVCKDFIRTDDRTQGSSQNCNGDTPIR